MQVTENGDGNSDAQSRNLTCLWRTKRSRSQYEAHYLPFLLRASPMARLSNREIAWWASNVQRNAMPSSCPFKQYRCNVLLPFAHCVLKDLEKADRAMISYSNYELRYATRRSLSPVIENGDENPPLQDPTACG